MRCLFTTLLLSLAIPMLAADPDAPATAAGGAEAFPVQPESRQGALERECEYGDHAMDMGNYRLAAEYFRRADGMIDAAHPEAGQIRLRLAQSLLADGQYDEAARQVADFMLRRRPDVPAAILDKLQLCAAEAQLRLKALDDAMRRLLELSRNASDPQVRHRALCLLADCYILKQEWSKAVELLESRRKSYTKWDHQRNEWQLELSKAQIMAKKFTEARLGLQSLLEEGRIEGQSRLLVQLQLVQALCGEGNPGEAMKLFGEIKECCPRHPDAVWQATLEQLCRAIKDAPAQSVELYRLLMQVAVDDSSRINYGIALAESLHAGGMDTEAMKLLAELLSQYPQNPAHDEIAIRLADLKFSHGDYRGAAALYAPVARSGRLADGSRYRVLLNLGKCHAALKEMREASDCYRRAGEDAGGADEAVKAFRMAAQCAEAGGDREGAIANYRTAARHDSEPLGIESLMESALLLRQMGRTAEALAEINRFIAIAGKNGNSSRLLPARLQGANWQRELAGNDPAALKAAEESLLSVAKQCVNEPELASRAYLEASATARRRGDLDTAIAIVGEFLRLPPPPAFLPEARRLAVLMAFQRGDDNAGALAEEYLAAPAMADGDRAEVAMLYADTLAAQGRKKFPEARKYYGIAASAAHGASAADARFEQAKLYSLGGTAAENAAAGKLLDELLADHDLSPQMRVKCLMLRGDIAADDGRLDDAVKAMDDAVDGAAGTSLESAARGRLAELLLACGRPEDALQAIDAVLGHYGDLPPAVQQHALFLKGLCLENAGRTLEAIRIYQDLCYRYDAMRERGIPAPWKYYSQAVWKLAGLQRQRKTDSALREAIHLLEKYSATALPRSREAASLSKQLRLELRSGD